MNGFSFLVVLICTIIIIGIAVGLLISLLIVACEVIRFWFHFKRHYKNGTWKDYIQYRSNPESFSISTRGGDILFDDLLNAIDTQSNLINPIWKYIKEKCFWKPGFYLMNKKWKPIIEKLKKFGLLTPISAKLMLISVDSFLSSVLFSNQPSIVLPILGSMRIGIHEFSRLKLYFNVLTLGLLTVTGSFAIGSWTIIIFLRALGLEAMIPTWLQVLATRSLFMAGETAMLFFAGQFVPPVCGNFATYLPEPNWDENLVLKGEDGIIIHVPQKAPKISLQMSKSQIKKGTWNSEILQNYESNPDLISSLEPFQELGSLDSNPQISHRFGNLRRSRTNSLSKLIENESYSFTENEPAPITTNPKVPIRSSIEFPGEEF
jgi:hypothetical protein